MITSLYAEMYTGVRAGKSNYRLDQAQRSASKMLRKIVAKEKSVTEYENEGGGEERTEKIWRESGKKKKATTQ